MRKGFIYGISCLALLGMAGVLTACGNDPLPIDAFVPDSSGDGPVCMGTIPYLETCMTNDQCADSCLCQVFGHEKLCTKRCSGNQDCPAPSSGCAMGVCQKP